MHSSVPSRTHAHSQYICTVVAFKLDTTCAVAVPCMATPSVQIMPAAMVSLTACLQVFVDSLIANESRAETAPTGPVQRSISLRLKFPYMRIRQVSGFVEESGRRLPHLRGVDLEEPAHVAVSNVMSGCIEVHVQVWNWPRRRGLVNHQRP